MNLIYKKNIIIYNNDVVAYNQADREYQDAISKKIELLNESHVCPTCYSVIDEETVKKIITISLLTLFLVVSIKTKISALNSQVVYEDYKLFHFGSKGRFTLKEVWDKVVITKIEYFEK